MTIAPDMIDGRATVARSPASAVLAEQWPMLAAALQRYQRNVAEAFAERAYGCVANGLIRLDDRRRLAGLAREMGIREFDAQLLIACAIRRWSLDHAEAWRASTDAQRAERRSRRRLWLRVFVVGVVAAAVDVLIVWAVLM